jgi:hypothetical protein
MDIFGKVSETQAKVRLLRREVGSVNSELPGNKG